MTKTLAEHSLRGRSPVRLIPHVLDLRFAENSGGAFSILGGQPWLFFGATVAICLVIAVVSIRASSPPVAAGMGLVLGGALGNLTDRVVRGPGVSGRVIDFIDLHHWPVFNLADSSIVIGAVMVVVWGLSRREAGAS